MMKSPIRNVLLFSIEDLNDWIEPLGGHPATRTPNLTRLAQRSVVFTNAQAPAPACGPSRTATMFGEAPWRTGIYNNAQDWGKTYPNSGCSLPGAAKAAGWTTFCAGKIFFRPADDGFAWTEELERHKKWMNKPEPISKAAMAGAFGPVDDFGPLDGENAAHDRRSFQWIYDRIRADSERTIWALGVIATHLPFTAPPAYFDGLPHNPGPPPSLRTSRFRCDDMTELADLASGGRYYAEQQSARGRVLERFGEYDSFVQAYLACIAFADDLLGKILDRLDELGLTDSTLIVLWSDHGWQFGEKLAFSKFTLWERALRVPFMFSGPGVTPRRVDPPVSLLDLYPTVTSLLGLSAAHQLDGDDLSEVLLDRGAPKGEAISAYWTLGEGGPSLTIRTSGFRLTRYSDGSMELYDHETDRHEHANLLASGQASENVAAIIRHLKARLPASATPPVNIDAAKIAKQAARRSKRMAGWAI